MSGMVHRWLARNEPFTSPLLEFVLGKKLGFSQMDSKETGLEILQDVRDEVEFQS